jgi:hypothetical protein
MDPLHYQALQCLRLCTFGVGSWDKRFVRDVSTLGEYDLLTPRQEESVERLAYRYRKQLAAHGYRVPQAFVQTWEERKRVEKAEATAKAMPTLKTYWLDKQLDYQLAMFELGIK